MMSARGHQRRRRFFAGRLAESLLGDIIGMEHKLRIGTVLDQQAHHIYYV